MSVAGRRRRRAALLGTALALAGLVVLAVPRLEDNLVYYRTPSELAVEPPGPQERVRVGGLVVLGSVRVVGDDGAVALRITDGAREVDVVHHGPLPAIFEDGQGAVVEGFLHATGFRSDRLMVRHSNEYAPPEAGPP